MPHRSFPFATCGPIPSVRAARALGVSRALAHDCCLDDEGNRLALRPRRRVLFVSPSIIGAPCRWVPFCRRFSTLTDD